MKKYLLLIIVMSCFSCQGKEKLEAIEPEIGVKDSIPKEKPVNLKIIPGKSIGNVLLEQNSEELDFLGEADLSDAAMGKAWLTWYSTNSKLINGKTELNVYTTYKDNEMKEKVVRQIRITSPDFKTDSGVQTGMPFSEMTVPNLRRQTSLARLISVSFNPDLSSSSASPFTPCCWSSDSTRLLP